MDSKQAMAAFSEALRLTKEKQELEKAIERIDLRIKSLTTGQVVGAGPTAPAGPMAPKAARAPKLKRGVLPEKIKQLFLSNPDQDFNTDSIIKRLGVGKDNRMNISVHLSVMVKRGELVRVSTGNYKAAPHVPGVKLPDDVIQ